MKINFGLICLIISFGFGNAQNFEVLYASPLNDRLYQMDQLDENNFNVYVYIENDTVYDNPNYLVKVEDKRIQDIKDTLGVVLGNRKNQILYTKEISDTIYSISGSYNSINSEIILAKTYNDVHDFVYLGDTSIKEVLFNGIFDANNNILINGVRNATNSNDFFVRKYNLNGTLINELNTSLFFPRLMFETSNGDYVVCNNTDKMYKFNNSLSVNTVLNVNFTNGISYPPKLSSGHLGLNGSVYLSGTKNYWLGTSNSLDDYSTVGLYKFENDQLLTLFEDTTLSSASEDVLNGFYTIDAIDSNYVYFGFMGEDCPYFALQQVDCKNDVLIYCTDINGNLNWSRKLGGDAKYHIYKILATQDRGCLVVVGRYHPLDSINNNEDLYYVKLDRNGNIQENYFSQYTAVSFNRLNASSFSLFPNPTNNLLVLEFDNLSINQSLMLSISDLQGKQVLIKQFHTNMPKVDVSALQKGYYIVQLFDNNEQIASRKILIE